MYFWAQRYVNLVIVLLHPVAGNRRHKTRSYLALLTSSGKRGDVSTDTD